MTLTIAILFNSFTSFIHKIQLSLNPSIVFFKRFWHRMRLENRCIKPNPHFIVIINTVLEQEEIHISLKVSE